MTPERYQQIGKLYHSALEITPGERPTFLAQACDGDEELLREVQSLVAAHEQAGSFIESPAIEVAAEILAADSYSDMVGQNLSHYEIKALLGVGGMGEVYLAHDTRLGRQVALKLLPGAFINDVDRVRRFEQEARAASALNHPNILTIYEIERAEDKHFIAMEYIDGETLREKIHCQRSPLLKLLKWLQQVAEGLAKAHAAGIVHRDLKPDNIMVTRDGYAKVLDFGLAKLIEQPDRADAGEATSSEAATVVMPQHSLPGMVRGTVGYMSPEQAQGCVKEIDQRSDIFSFGCILFEAATGHRAFEGKDTLDSLHKLVHAPTPQIKETKADAPDELQRIVRRCLAKDPERRYQSIKDVAIELEELYQELKAEHEAQLPAQLVSNLDTTPSVDAQAGVSSASQSAVSIAEAGWTRQTTSAGYLVNDIERHKTGAALIILALAVAIAGIAYGLYKLVWHKPATSPPSIKITRLTTTSNVFWGAISPDGKYIVYSVGDERGLQNVWVKQVATPSKVEIVAPSDAVYGRFTFTRDGSYIYFNKVEASHLASIYRIPALGGLAQKVVENAASRAALSPDEKRLAFIRGDAISKETSLVVANSDGSAEQTLATRKSPDYFFFGVIAWSPDGKSITCLIGNSPAAGTFGIVPRASGRLINVPVDGGVEKPVDAPKWIAILSIEWLADGSGLIVIAQEQPSLPAQVWYLSYPGGEAHRITNDFNNYLGVSLTADDTALVTIQRETTTHIWVAPDGDANHAKEITTGTGREDGARNISWTPDSKIVYDSTASGSRHVWIMNMDGSDQRQLTEGNHDNQWQTVSPDGRYLVFASNRTGAFHIWRMNIDGSNLKKLTDGAGESGPFFSPDGQWVLYSDYSSGSWKVPADGGEPVRLTSDGRASSISPDGKLVAYARQSGPGTGNIEIIPFEGGSPIKSFEITSTRLINIHWTSDGRTIIYNVLHGPFHFGVSNLWSQSLDGGQPVQLTNFKSETFVGWDQSRDGKWFAFGRGHENNDVVLIKDFRW
jgi:serine/threonine protein kinase/dipeptidyl aminopeptidase/acylaminoacyl peptidase